LQYCKKIVFAMKKMYLGLLALAGATELPAYAQTLPATPKRPVTDTYFGKKVVDNYRWLEDTNSPEVQAWFKAQGDYTAQTLDQIPGRDRLIKTFEDYDKLLAVRYGEIKQRGNRYFYRKTLPSEKVGKLYIREGKTGPEKLLFDPLSLATDKQKSYAMSAFTPSPNGQLIVIGLQEGGAELSTLRTMTVATKVFRSETIPAVFGGSVDWLPDNSGFLYTPQNSNDPKDPKGNLDTKGRLHRLGTAPSADPDLFSLAKNPDMGIRPDQYPIMYYSNDHTQLYGELSSVDRRSNSWVATPTEVGKAKIAWKRLATPTDSVYRYFKIGSRLYLHSVKGAPNGRILVTDAATPNTAAATVLLPEGKQNITGVTATKDYLFVTLSDGINEHIRQYSPAAKQWADVPLPTKGTVGIEPYDPGSSNEAMVYVTSWNDPGKLYD
jgi:prolyl oligopeptidase